MELAKPANGKNDKTGGERIEQLNDENGNFRLLAKRLMSVTPYDLEVAKAAPANKRNKRLRPT